MSDCCSDYRCRRASPIQIRRESFSGQWVALTKYRVRESNNGGPAILDALQKHYLPPVSQAIIELSGSTLITLAAYVKRRYQSTASAPAVQAAYRDVLDRLAILSAAKESELIDSPVSRTSTMNLTDIMGIVNRWSESTPEQQRRTVLAMADRLAGRWGYRYSEHLEHYVATLEQEIAELRRRLADRD